MIPKIKKAAVTRQADFILSGKKEKFHLRCEWEQQRFISTEYSFAFISLYSPNYSTKRSTLGFLVLQYWLLFRTVFRFLCEDFGVRCGLKLCIIYKASSSDVQTVNFPHELLFLFYLFQSRKNALQS